ncbi:MAG: YgiQ family radical SAM protein [Bacteroidales bacterium]|nr:YgiQ family radical SAM protein [Bacteroidales bacterium]
MSNGKTNAMKAQPNSTQPLLSDWLPTTRREMELRGWEQPDVVLFSGDAYVDHPSFGAAVVGRLIEAEGLRICIVPQPDWHGDFRDFKRFGRPRLFFAISPGNMDSMVNRYTAARRLRSEDAYSPNGSHSMRPEMPSIVYTRILKQLYPDAPVILGGIEASLRRVTHYDYWKNRMRPCLLAESQADLIIYGMGEKPIPALCRLIEDKLCHGKEERYATAHDFHQVLRRYPIPQTVVLEHEADIPGGLTPDDIVLHSHEASVADKRKHAANFRHVEEESNKWEAQRMVQQIGRWVDDEGQEHYEPRFAVINPPYPPLTQAEVDHSFDLPYTRLPHPKYRGKTIPAYEMIKFSVNMHRGCFGGCSFCTISAHQGKFIQSRSKESIVREVRKITQMPDFKGYLSDLGGPSANMYGMQGKNLDICRKCKKPSCIHPKVCPNLNADHAPMLEIFKEVDALPGMKKSFIGSGVRYDLLLHPYKEEHLRKAAMDYARELIVNHVSGRLKVAPEHTSDRVLNFMRKPSFQLFHEFKRLFDRINREAGLRQQLIPYFISSHPGCLPEDMADLAVQTKDLDFQLEQVQDFTPTPMTVSTEAWTSGYHPYTLEEVFSAHTPEDKKRQHMFFFWYKPEERQRIVSELRRLGREDLIARLYPQGPGARPSEKNSSGKNKGKREGKSKAKSYNPNFASPAKPSHKTHKPKRKP